MDEINSFLNLHSQIEQVVLLVGEEYGELQLKDFLRENTLHCLTLVSTFDTQKIQHIKEFIELERYRGDYVVPETFVYHDFNEFYGLSGDWLLCADWILPGMLLKAAKWAPSYLVATIWKERISAFKVWECYKEKTSYIQIKTVRSDHEDQMLVWEKSIDSDIELSLIFPMYNVEKYLDQCIASVTSWKAPYVEFLFVNDGSPDHSRDVVLKWAQNDSRIKLIDKKNGGCASARQLGLEQAKGNYVGFVDPDDFVDESMFRKLLKAAMVGSYDVSYCGYNEYYENTQETKRVDDTIGAPYCHGISDLQTIRELIPYCRVAIWRGIYRKKMIESAGIHFYTDLRRFDDLPFKIEIFAAAKSVIAVQEWLYYYRLARPGQDVSANDEKLYVHFDIFKYLNQSIGERHDPILTDYLGICKLQTHLYALKKIRSDLKKEYIQKACEDLNTTSDPKRFYKIIKKCLGKKQADYYNAIIKKNTKCF